MRSTCTLLMFSLLACFGSSAQISSSDQVFSKIVPALIRKTSVPLRIPTYLPGLGNGDFHAIINSADEAGYIIVLGATPDCEGQHVCSYGALIGTAHPLRDLDFYNVSRAKSLRVHLHQGVIGDFYATTCAAYCDDSLMVWTEGKYHYIIGLKAESKSNMIRAQTQRLTRRNERNRSVIGETSRLHPSRNESSLDNFLHRLLGIISAYFPARREQIL